MAKTICGIPIKNYHYYDLNKQETVTGTVLTACRDPRCMHQHCINSRIYRPFERFHNTFGKDDAYYMDFKKCPGITIEVLKEEALKLFDSHMVFDCFTFYRLVVSRPVNKFIDLSWFNHIKKFNKFLLNTLRHCKIAPVGFEGNVSGRRIFYHNIHRNKIERKVPVVDGHFAVEKQGRISEHVKKAKFVPLESVRFKIEEHGLIRDVGYPEVVTNPYYMTFVQDIHCFRM